MKKALPELTPEEWMATLRSAHAARADLIARIVAELEPLLGAEEAIAVIHRATHAMGLAKQPRYEKYLQEEGEHSPAAFCRVLVGHSPLVAKLFEMSLGERKGETADIHLERCVLLDGWRAQGHDDQTIARLCRAARGVDYGTLEGLGLTGEFDELLSEGGHSCHLVVARAQNS